MLPLVSDDIFMHKLGASLGSRLISERLPFLFFDGGGKCFYEIIYTHSVYFFIQKGVCTVIFKMLFRLCE